MTTYIEWLAIIVLSTLLGAIALALGFCLYAYFNGIYGLA